MTTRRTARKVSVPKITRTMLRQATNIRYFQRGEGYFDAGLVRSVKQKDGKVYATVHGSHQYRTVLCVEHDAADGSCTCPLGQDNEFCKHLVATGLTWIDSTTTDDGSVKPKRIEPDDIQAWLQKQSPEKLVETIMAQAMTDDEFYNVLRFRVAAEQPAANIPEMRAVLRQAMEIEAFVSWREASEYARGVERVVERLNTMVEKHATEVVELADYALELWEDAVDFLGQIQRLMVGMNKEAEFKQDLLAIKTEWKRLRNFIKYVERRKWGK